MIFYLTALLFLLSFKIVNKSSSGKQFSVSSEIIPIIYISIYITATVVTLIINYIEIQFIIVSSRELSTLHYLFNHLINCFFRSLFSYFFYFLSDSSFYSSTAVGFAKPSCLSSFSFLSISLAIAFSSINLSIVGLCFSGNIFRTLF